MPAFISPLDDQYISFKRAAALIQQERPEIDCVELMEMFKHALFNREFERKETDIAGIDPGDEHNLPLLRIEAPPKPGRNYHLGPEHQPQEYLAVKAKTVAELLVERDALPGDMERWRSLTSFPQLSDDNSDALDDLARIPYSAFPAAGRHILDTIVLAKAKLRSWMVFKSYPLPVFLEDVEQSAPKEANAVAAEAGALAEGGDGARGRPRKTGWLRVERLIRDLHAARPDAQRSTLAFDAHKLAMREFDENDLPSVETITRQMKTILATEA